MDLLLTLPGLNGKKNPNKLWLQKWISILTDNENPQFKRLKDE